MGEALLVRKGGGGVKVTVDGVEISKDLSLESKRVDLFMPSLPISFSTAGKAVKFNGKLHLLANTAHYAWDGTTWASVSTLPYSISSDTNVVVYDGKIHLLGGGRNSSNYTAHYAWDGTTWTSVETLPWTCRGGAPAAYDSKLHLLGGSVSSKAHYAWDGTTWTSVETLPFYHGNGAGIVHDGRIHLMGGNSSTQHYAWDGTTWASAETLPFRVQDNNGVIEIDGEIHLLGGPSTEKVVNYRLADTGWILDSTHTIPSNATVYSDYDNAINVLGNSTDAQKHYIINEKMYKEVS